MTLNDYTRQGKTKQNKASTRQKRLGINKTKTDRQKSTHPRSVAEHINLRSTILQGTIENALLSI